MIDHITDATTRDHVRERDEAQQREIERLTGLARRRGYDVFVLKSACAALFAFLVCAAVYGGIAAVLLYNANADRDAAEAQSALYLDGWNQCVKAGEKTVPADAGYLGDVESGTALSFAPSPYFTIDMGSPSKLWPAGTCAREAKAGRKYAHCYDRGSLLDPTRRIDR